MKLTVSSNLIGIQKATPDDLPEILHLQKLAFTEVALAMDNFNLPPLQQTQDDLSKEYESGIILKYLSADEKLVGSVRGCMDNDHICHVGKLIVHPGYQNQGIGKALMYEIEKYFPACSKFELFTGEETPNTLHLYKK
ncbi:MAG: GNAT family N-acetyltransferase [Parabacteroides sp.]|nr:GNAT family N-acetyltransferase [Parabacteroides sp.]